MAEIGFAERLLRRERFIVLAALAVLFALATTYTVLGVGMKMSALEMTQLRGTEAMPSMAAAPGMAPEGGGAAAPAGMSEEGTAGMEMAGSDMAGGGAWSAGYAVLVFLMWWVMMIAMMLPSVAPVVLLYAALGRHGSAARSVPRRAAAFVAGYLLVWALFSALASFAQWGLERQGLVSMMTLTGSTAGALVLIAAGVFQFTPLKQGCLNHCRAPAEVLTRHRVQGAGGALRLGMEHGAYCLGCCWFLMALLFVGGIMNLYWIAGLALWVVAEKYLPRGDLVSKGAGAVLIVWGAAILTGLF